MKIGKILTVAAVAAGAAATAKMIHKKQQEERVSAARRQIQNMDHSERRAFFVGGGLASMAGAAYLIRDLGFDGNRIYIYEGLGIVGGSNDGSGTKDGFLCRGGRMLNEETYENFWELFSTIPSLDAPNRSVTEEILNFDHAHPTCAKARLVDRNGKILDVHSMGFNNQDRFEMTKLLATREEDLDDLTIRDWFNDHFFTTNFWDMWQTTFAFQEWSSLFEFKRYMDRMIFEFSRIETLEGVTRTPYNQYESVILPIRAWLIEHGVHFETGAVVTDIDFTEDAGVTASAIHLADGQVIAVREQDLCLVINGCMTDSATVGDMHTPAPAPDTLPMSGELWGKIAAKKPGLLGDPRPFFGNAAESNWQSFTVTCRGNKLLKMIEQFSGNIPGSGALMTFKDSSWRMSIVIAAQPHFKAQTPDTTIFWGYGLYTDRIGDYVKKPMKDCTGEEILREFIGHMHWEDRWTEIVADVVNVIPCYMPYVDAQFQPRKMSDRPPVVPRGSTNFAMISQFVEIPKDMVFTEEYSVRAARIAVYTLLDCDLPIEPVTPYNKDPRILAKALHTMYR